VAGHWLSCKHCRQDFAVLSQIGLVVGQLSADPKTHSTHA